MLSGKKKKELLTVLSITLLTLLFVFPVFATDVVEEEPAINSDISTEAVARPDEVLVFNISAEEGSLYLRITGSELEGKSQFYLNIDEDNESGFTLDEGKAGFDYLVENGVLFRYRQFDGGWERIIAINYHNYGDKVLAAIPLSLLSISEEVEVIALFRSNDKYDTDIIAKGFIEMDFFAAEYSFSVQTESEIDDYDDIELSRSEPTVVLMGSPEIVLYLNSAYVEQGATAWDNVDGDLSDLVYISGDVNTSIAANYRLVYSVHNTEGIIGRTSRTIRVIEPVLRKDRASFSFSGSFSQNEISEIAIFPFQNDSVGLMSMSLKVSGGQMEATIRDSKGFVVNREQFSEDKAEHYNNFQEGEYTLTIRPIQILNNLNYNIQLLMPVVMTEEYEEEEIPLGAVDISALTVPKTGGEGQTTEHLWILVALSLILGAVILVKKKLQVNR